MVTVKMKKRFAVVATVLLALCHAPSAQAQTLSSPGGAADVASGGFSTNSSWGDFDSDGDLDAYVTNWASIPNLLYQNNGDGVFTDIAAAAGVPGAGNSVAAAWGDYDNDGELDL